MNTVLFWILFNAGIISLLILDLTVFHRKEKIIDIKTSLLMNSFWIILALLFNVGVYHFKGTQSAINFFTGYLVEYALSIDNLFVFILIFSHFKVPEKYLHKVLFWGVLGAIVMRALFILGGLTLISYFHWMFYIFGAFLIVAGLQIAFVKEKKISFENNFLLNYVKKRFPISDHYSSDRFFIKKGNRYIATPLFLVLLAVESTDLIFALDSIPAIMGITTDPLIIYTSNIFAILGLRSLYFTLHHLLSLFYYLHYALGAILVFIGIKMLIASWITIPLSLTLGFIISALALAMCFSKEKIEI